MHADLETLAIALYVKVDDDLKSRPELAKPRRSVGITPKLTDAELVTMAVMQVLLNIRSERRWLRYMGKHLRHLFPYQPKQPGYNKRLRAALPLIKHTIRALAVDTDFWYDNHWILDSTPVECGRSRPTVERSEAAGWATYGYCASHSRFFWGLRLYLICTPTGMPIIWALADAKIGEREVVQAMLDQETHLLDQRPGLLLITDKGFASKRFELDGPAFSGQSLNGFLCCDLPVQVLVVDLLRSLIAESRVETSHIIEQFDVTRNIPPRMLPSRVLCPMHALCLQRGEERFRESIVIADAGSAN